MVARVYPVASHAETFFIDRDGVTRTTVRLNVSDWKNVTVTALGGRSVTGQWRRNAFEFVIVPGETYELR